MEITLLNVCGPHPIDYLEGTKGPSLKAQMIKVFPGGSDGKESACNAGDLGSIPGIRKILLRRKWQPTLVFLPGKFQVWRSLVGYNLWGHKESYMTEQLA